MSLIGFKLDSDIDALDTNDDTSFELTMNNPLLGDAEYLSPGSMTTPFNLPGGETSKKNAARLKNPDVLENSEVYQPVKSSLYFDDNFFKKGDLSIENANGNNIETSFTFGLNSLAPGLKEARLRELLNETIVIDNTPITKKIYLKHYGTEEISITVNGKSYSGVSWTVIAGAINADQLTDAANYSPYAEIVGVGGANTPSGFSPEYIVIWLRRYFTYVDPVTHIPIVLPQDNIDPLAELSVEIDNDEDSGRYTFDHNLAAAYVPGFNTFLAPYLSGAYPNDKIRFPVMFNPGLHQDSIKYNELINGVTSTGFLHNSPSAVKAYNSLQPFLRFKYVMDKIAEAYDFVWDGDFYTSTDMEERMIDNSVALDVPQIFYRNQYIFWRRDFNLNELVPDIKVIEFLKSMASRYNLGVYVDEVTRKVSIRKREVIALATGYEDITSISSPIYGGPKNETLTGLRVICKKEDSDAFSMEEAVITGIAQDDIDITCGRLHQITTMPTGSGELAGPRVSRKLGDKFNLRVFYYRGLTTNGSLTYPTADISSSVFYEGLQDNISLAGMYGRFWKYWITFTINRRVIKLDVNWQLRQLLQFDWSLKRRFDRSNFLVKSIKIKMTPLSFKVSAVELITMK